MTIPRSKRPIRWKKSKWYEGTRVWKSTVIMRRSQLYTLHASGLSVNKSEYMGSKINHLLFKGCRWSRLYGHLYQVILCMSERDRGTYKLSIRDNCPRWISSSFWIRSTPEGGLFGTPVVHQFDIYAQASFADLFKR